MNNNIKRNALFAALLLGCVLLAPAAQAASFDCGKAGTKVERLICADSAISRLDDELAKIYGGALKLSPDKNQLMQEQREWLKARNRKCSDERCLVISYQERIKELINTYKELDGYTLLMSKNDELCNHMLKQFTEDLQKYPRGSNQHEEFELVPWEPTQYSYEHGGRIDRRDVEGALFDINNDGVRDFVVRNQSMLSSMRADSISVFEGHVAERVSDLSAKEFYEAANRIDIAGSVYPLSATLDGRSEGVWLLSPFIYHGVSYLYMQSVYEPAGYKNATEDVMLISKYGGGRFVQRDMSGKMEDICYFKRFGVQR